MKNISRHISYEEAIKSQSAQRMGIPNLPTSDELFRMQVVAERVFEPLREHFGKPLVITSFYRCPKLNAAIGGSRNSRHCLGEAIDIDGNRTGVSNKEIFEYIMGHLEFDQLIWEFGDDKNPAWVHVSYTTQKNRKQVMRAVTKNGQTVYQQL